MKKLIFVCLIFLMILLAGCQKYSLAQNDLEPIPTFTLPNSTPKIALVLGGGGSKGLAHIGVLRELVEAGIHPDMIVGCSSGALIGALYADQPDVKRLEDLLIELKRSDLLDFSLFSLRFGIVKGHSLQNFILQNLNAVNFDTLKIPLIVVATDLLTGELIELGGGPLLPAIRGSTAVPGVFKPVPYLGRHLVDGGAVDPVPVRIAKKYGAKIIIAVDVGETLSKEEPLHLFGIARRGISISYRQLSLHAARDADIVIRMNFQDLGMFSDRYNQEIYETGRIKAREALPQIKTLIADRLSPFPTESAPSWLSIE